MKIKKINETSIYKSCTKEDLIETQKKKKEILDFERETVYPMLVEYIRFNPKVTKEKILKISVIFL